jgi:hypothetical protein
VKAATIGIRTLVDDSIWLKDRQHRRRELPCHRQTPMCCTTKSDAVTKIDPSRVFQVILSAG